MPSPAAQQPNENEASAKRIVSTDTHRENRIPPRQVLTKKWPILHEGAVPATPLDQWDFRVFRGASGAALDMGRVASLPVSDVFADMHCVTRWSRLNMTWRGVLISDLFRTVEILPEAKFVLVHSEHGFTTNLPLADLLSDDVLVAWWADGENLTPDHGWPLRLVVPKLYAWKSAKWVRGLEFMPQDKPGFWERSGYHMRGDPWQEERFGAWQ